MIHWTAKLALLRDARIPDDHLNPPNNFEMVRERAAEVIEELDDLQRRLENVGDALPYELKREADSYADELVDAVNRGTTAATELIQAMGLTAQQFSDRRLLIVGQFVESVEAPRKAKRAAVLSGVLAAQALNAAKAVEAVGTQREELATLRSDLESTLKSGKAWSEKVEGIVAQYSEKSAISSFADLSSAYKGREKVWMYATFAALAFGAFMLLEVLSLSALKIETLPVIIKVVTFDVVMLGAATFAIRFAVRRWNLERNLRLVYAHRVAALQQYRVFDALIPADDREARERLRLKLSELLFSDPQTGYREDTVAELSINPVINVVEQLAGKVKS